MIKCIRFGIAILAVGLVAGCDSSREMLGLDKSAPDEFAVYSRAPLSLPPDYALKPPAPGQTRPQASEPARDARRALLGDRAQPVSVPKGGSLGLQALYKATGADRADPSIRETVNQETSILAEEDKSVTDKIMFFGTPTEYGSAVDAEKENKRIQENQALGKPITEGEVPVLKKKRKAILEGLFN